MCLPHSKSVYDMPRSSSYFLSFIFIIPSWHILRHCKLMWKMFELNSFCCSNTIHESGEKLVHEICKNKVNLISVIWWDISIEKFDKNILYVFRKSRMLVTCKQCQSLYKQIICDVLRDLVPFVQFKKCFSLQLYKK